MVDREGWILIFIAGRFEEYLIIGDIEPLPCQKCNLVVISLIRILFHLIILKSCKIAFVGVKRS